jgi:hypothetical protein
MTHFYQEANDPEWPEDFETISRHSSSKAAIRAGSKRYPHGYFARDCKDSTGFWWVVAEWIRDGRTVARVVR